MNNDTVDIRQLTHRYGNRTALDGVSLAIPAGTLFALLGPNGGGKTTLFKILATLIRPTSGGATIAGSDVVSQPAEVRGRIGIVFQHPSLDDKLSVRENMTHQGHLYGLSGRELTQRTLQMLDRFGIADRARDRVGKLSGGMQRRVELAKALLHRPQVLILDEPSTGLDPGARNLLMETLFELRTRDGMTCLLTTHLMEEADRCDELAILDGGKLVAKGTPNELKGTIGGDVVTITCKDAAGLATAAKAKFDVAAEADGSSVRIERHRGHEFVPQLVEAFPGEIETVTVGKPTLDDVFLHLTGHRLWDGAAEKAT